MVSGHFVIAVNCDPTRPEKSASATWSPTLARGFSLLFCAVCWPLASGSRAVLLGYSGRAFGLKLTIVAFGTSVTQP